MKVAVVNIAILLAVCTLVVNSYGTSGAYNTYFKDKGVVNFQSPAIPIVNHRRAIKKPLFIRRRLNRRKWMKNRLNRRKWMKNRWNRRKWMKNGSRFRDRRFQGWLRRFVFSAARIGHRRQHGRCCRKRSCHRRRRNRRRMGLRRRRYGSRHATLTLLE